MRLNTKIKAIACLTVGISVLAFMGFQQRPPDPPVTNLKVLPKKLTFRQVDHIMDDWNASLGVRCNFCHVRDTKTNKMDFASDAKPEKEMARHMYKMTVALNKKYFKDKEKDSLGVAKFNSVNCNTCHRGVAHIEVFIPKRGSAPGGQRPPQPPPGAPAPQGAPPAQQAPPGK